MSTNFHTTDGSTNVHIQILYTDVFETAKVTVDSVVGDEGSLNRVDGEYP